MGLFWANIGLILILGVSIGLANLIFVEFSVGVVLLGDQSLARKFLF